MTEGELGVMWLAIGPGFFFGAIMGTIGGWLTIIAAALLWVILWTWLRRERPEFFKRNTAAWIAGGIYAVLHNHEWHLAYYDGEAFSVISESQSGDRWLPEWIDEHVFIAESVEA